MLQRDSATDERDDLAAIWSAARSATADAAVADAVTVVVMARARRERRRGTPIARNRLVADAVRRVIARSPIPPLDRVTGAERETIALGRFAQLTVDEIATAMAVDASVVKERMRDGLRTIAKQRRPRTAPFRAVSLVAV